MNNAIKQSRGVPSVNLATFVIAIALFTHLVYGQLQTNYGTTSATKTSKPSADSLVVSTTSGSVQGAPFQQKGAQFLGIPYAEPPIGDFRWRPPVPKKAWAGVLDATKFAAPCSQAVLGDWNRRDATLGQENCLYLNVITPEWPAKAKLPVMVWIHGGANAGGSAESPLYKDGTLVEHGVILVTINYRLGIFGFLAHPQLTKESADHASGNYALMDQIAALRWVRDNIPKFGGDPQSVTLFGQSAGAQDTSVLMTSPLAKGLFHKAIAESGTAMNPPAPSLADAEAAGAKLVSQINKANAADAIQYLRSIPANDLIKMVPAQDPAALPQFGTIVDGLVITRQPASIFAAGQESSIPLITGSTTREFDVNVPPDALRGMIRQFSGTFADRTLEAYGLSGNNAGNNDPMYGPPSNQWFADIVFRCASTTQAGWHFAAKNQTWSYQLERAIPGHESEGSVHSTDLPYVFGYYPKTGNLAGGFNSVDFNLADVIETYWTNFARTGNPNGKGLTEWPAFESGAYMRFTEEGKAIAEQTPLRKAQCDLFRDALSERMRVSK